MNPRLRLLIEGIAGARWCRLFGASACVMLLVWLPLVFISMLDSLALFMTPAELGDMFASNVLLLFSLCAVLALLGHLIGAFAGQFSRPLGVVSAWVCVLAYPTFVAFSKVGAAIKAWIEISLNHSLIFSGPQKLALLVTGAILAVSGLLFLHRGNPRHLATAASQALLGSFPLAIALAAASLAWLVWRPPVFHWPAQRVAANKVTATGIDEARQPDIILISIDALAAADVKPCDALPSDMPQMQALARHATCFSQFYSSSNYTIPTTSTMETGTLPWTHWSVSFNSSLPQAQRENSIAALLHNANYSTHSLSANQWASPRQHGTFEYYDSQDVLSSRSWNYTFAARLTDLLPNANFSLTGLALFPFLLSWDIRYRGHQNPWDSDALYARAKTLLDLHTNKEQPLFLWAHTMLPHSPYLPPMSTRYRLLPKGQLDEWKDLLPDNFEYPVTKQPLVDAHRLRYRESIMAADEALGRFLDQLKASGRYEDSIIIVTADHGESFEKGFLGHTGRWLHNALIHIPLIVKLPRQNIAHAVSTPVSQADLAPTLVELASARSANPIEGRSLVPALNGSSLTPRPVFSMNLERQSRFKPLESGQIAMIDGTLKLTLDIASGLTTLYDVIADPDENREMSVERPDEVRRMRRAVLQRVQLAESSRARTFGR